ncbi:MAG: DUF2508 family protein [Thermaerobacter sp.]|nr:DUF2508 family protein [Thermaerobacter sp.]
MATDWQGLRQRLLPAREQAADTTYFELAQAAHRELEAAYSQFREVKDPDLVDHAIYRVHAAERHYIFLLRQVRETQDASAREGGRIGSIGG